ARRLPPGERPCPRRRIGCGLAPMRPPWPYDPAPYCASARRGWPALLPPTALTCAPVRFALRSQHRAGWWGLSCGFPAAGPGSMNVMLEA
ncbi:MAG TPA: hypothetical protein VG476_04790, partial [Acidimicrobiales bacterium]|nr:hypothetical protein [Acidimicrobiales bacterium]